MYCSTVLIHMIVFIVLIYLVRSYESANSANNMLGIFEDNNKVEPDLTKLLDEKLFIDIHLKCGDKVYAAHKNILATKSKFFNSLFLNELKLGPVVIIPDIDCDIFSLFLRYLYNGKLPVLTEYKINQLYIAANKYGVVSLKKDCAAYMITNVSSENIWDYMDLANTYSDSKFKSWVMSKLLIMLSNSPRMLLKSPEILKTKSFLNFGKKYPELAIEIYQKYTENYEKSRNFNCKADLLNALTGCLQDFQILIS